MPVKVHPCLEKTTFLTESDKRYIQKKADAYQQQGTSEVEALTKATQEFQDELLNSLEDIYQQMGLVKTKPKKSDEKKAKVDSLLGELDDLINSGLGAISDPKQEAERQLKITMKGAEIVSAYIDLGVTRFQEMARDIYDRYGEPALRKFLDAMKKGYGSVLASADDIEAFDDIKTVRGHSVESLIKLFQEEDGKRDTTVPDDTGTNAPQLPGGEATKETGEPVPDGDSKGVPEPDSGQGGQRTGGPKEAGTKGRRGAGSGEQSDTVPAERGESGTPEPKSDRTDKGESPNDLNHRIKDEDVIIPGGEISKIKANIAAIKLVKKLYEEDRNATPEEKQTLAKFVGWGGLAPVLDERKAYQGWDDNWNKKYKDYHVQLKELLNEDEFRTAVNSTINAHYTDRRVINQLWDLADRLGFKGGNVLEPSAGVGHFFGLMPEAMAKNSNLKAYELDNLTGQILSKLYPKASVKIKGYEESVEANNSQDLVISNVPFAAKAPFDAKNKDLSSFSLHNYFIAKGIRQLKPGGLGIFITSMSSMDNVGSSTKFREWTNTEGNADFVGAIRLPNNAFSENAGTQVTTDILIYKKRTEDKPSDINQQYRNVVPISKTKDSEGKIVDVSVNEFFAKNPDMMLGTMKLAHEAGSGGLYSADVQTLQANPGQDTQQLLKDAIGKLPENIFGAQVSNKSELTTAEGEKEGSLVERNGKVFLVENGELVPQGDETVTGNNSKKYKKSEVVKDYTAVKSAAVELVQAEQSEESSPESIEDLRKALNKAYNTFVKKYGTLNRNQRVNFLEDDAGHSQVFALEDIKKTTTLSETGKATKKYSIDKSEIFEKRVNFPFKEPDTAENISDAVNISLSYRNSIDLPYIASMTGVSEEEAKKEVLSSGLAFENPKTGLLEDSDSYLSGFVRQKLHDAKEAGRGFEKNVEELEKVIPKDIPAQLIEFRLGSTWLPPFFVEKFVQDNLGVRADIRYNPVTGNWVTNATFDQDERNRITYASGEDFTAMDLVEKVLNLRQPEVSYTVKNPDGSKTTVKDAGKTAAAQAKAQELADMFYNYVKGNKEMLEQIETIWNETRNGFTDKKYSLPVFKHFPGANKAIQLRIHQMKAVMRGLRDSVLLAHQVGTGKTFTMITTAMEMRRLGIARKPMMVVQNSTLEQFGNNFKKLYPGSKILAPTKKDMDSKHRQALLNKIAYGDWDAVIIPQSFLDFIPDDEDRVRGYLMEQLDELEAAEAEAKENGDRGTANDAARAIRELEKQLEKVQENNQKKTKKVKDTAKDQLAVEKAHKKQASRRKDDVLKFEDMGVDALFIDEAHEYKKLGFLTKMNRIKGIDVGRSQKALGAFMKVRWVQEKNKGKNVILATGTPITNTMAEVWTMMKFVAPDVLERYNIKSFDEFATTFGNVDPSLEFTASGKFKIVERFKSYINAPELLTAFRAKTDVVLTEDIPEFKEGNTIAKLKTQEDGKPGFTRVTLKQTAGLKNAMAGFRSVLERWEKLTGKEKRALSHIPLLIFNRAKQAAIDLRLIDPKEKDDPASKTNEVVKQVKRIYDESSAYQGAQLVFSDMFQSPEVKEKYLDEEGTIPNPAYGQARFNLFEDIKDKLIKAGVKPEEIAIIHDFQGEKRQPMFDKVKEGKIRVLLGTTPSMGVGVDVQDRLAALHHIDAPPRPMDFEQRNGRILRQGNLHAEMEKPVEIVTYGVEKTLDATAYQRLAFKSKFINQMMKAEGVDRVVGDEADEDNASDMTFDQMMSTLSGSQFAVMHTQKSFDLRKLKTSKANHERNIIEFSGQIRKKESLIQALKDTHAKYLPVITEFKEAFPENKITSVTVDGVEHKEKLSEALEPAIKYLLGDVSYIDFKPVWFKINGNIPVHLKPNHEYSIRTGKDEKWVEYTILSSKDKDVGISPKTTTVSTAQGLIASLNASINGFIEEGYNGHTNILTIPDRVEQNKKDIKALEEQIKKPFEKEEKISQLQAEVADLEEKMKAENIAENDTPKPDRDPNDFEGEQDFNPASTQQPTNPPIGATRKGRKGRIAPSPLLGAEAKSIREIMVDLSKVIDAKIWYSKRPGRRKSLGLYVPSSGSMVIRYTDDLDTTAHELGHSIDDKFDLLDKAMGDPKAERELMKLSKYGSSPSKGHPDPRAYKLNEGIAEYIRAWLVNPVEAEKQFPVFAQMFTSTLPPGVQDSLRKFGDDIRRYVGLPAIQKIQSKVQWEPKEAEGFWSKLVNNNSKENFELTVFDRFTQAWLNQMRPFEKAVDWLLDKQEIADYALLKPSRDPRVLVRLLFGMNNKVQDVIKHGFVDNGQPINKDGSVNRIVDSVTDEPMSFEWLLGAYDNTDVASLDRDVKDAMGVAIARRTLELSTKLKREDYLIGVGAGIFSDVKVAEKALEEFDSWNDLKKERIEEGIRRYRAYANAGLELAVASGRVSQQWLDEVRDANMEYVALNRIAEAGPDEEMVTPGTGSSKSLGAVADIIHKIKGSTKAIKNPYQAMLDNTIRIIKESERNNVLLAFRDLLTHARGMNEGDVKYLGSVATKVGSDGQNTQVIMVNGKKEYWKMDPDLYKFMKHMGSSKALPGWLTALPRMLRWGVIHFPVFALRNRMRDFQQRLVVSKHGWSGIELNLKPGLRKKVKEAYEQLGGGQSGHWLMNEEAFYTMQQKTMHELAKDKRNILVDPRRFFSEAGDLYNRVLQSGETATRLEEYRSAFRDGTAKGMDPYNASIYAAFKSRDLMDFAVAGEVMAVVNQLVPFSNAAVQGLRKSIRSAKEDPGGFAVRFTIYSLIPAIMMRMLAHYFDRDEEYANLPDYRRDLFYNIPVGDDLWLVIPKSFEIGVLGSAGDRLAGKFFYDEKDAFDGYAGSVARSVVPMDETALAGPAKGVLEVAANYDFFRNQHIIPTSEEGTDLSLRDTSRASRLGKVLSEAFGIDPRNIDHLIKSNTGYFGDFALRLSDIGREDSRYKLVDWSTTGVFRHDPVYESKSVQKLMDTVEKWGLKSVSAPQPVKQLMQVFNMELNGYFTADSPEEKAAAGKRVRESADVISGILEAIGADELQQVKHGIKMEKRGLMK